MLLMLLQQHNKKEPAQPTIFYINFLNIIIACNIGLAVLEPLMINGERERKGELK